MTKNNLLEYSEKKSILTPKNLMESKKLENLCIFSFQKVQKNMWDCGDTDATSRLGLPPVYAHLPLPPLHCPKWLMFIMS